MAGALIGLLFVAITVSEGRLSRREAGAQVHRIRASAALTAFTNALTVSLFALIPEQLIGGTAFVVGILGLLFVIASLLSLVRMKAVRWRTVHDALFLAGLGVTFVFQVIAGADVYSNPGDSGSVNTIAIMVVVCFLIGVARSWELVGGPSIGITREVVALVRNHDHGAEEPGEEEPGEEESGTEATAQGSGTGE